MSYTELYTVKAASFLGFESVQEPEYVVLGVPYDGTSTYRPGSRFAPDAIREASMNIETYSLRARLDAETIKVEDLGNLHVATDVHETLRRLSLVVEEQASRGRRLLILGGEHTVTLGAMDGFKHGYPAVLCFDAHMDLRDEYMGSRVNHATVFRRLCEQLGADRIMMVGVRAFTEEELSYAQEAGLRFFTSLEVSRDIGYVVEKVKSWLDGVDRLYISIDLDVLDPSQAPAVGNPEPEGLTTTQLLDMLWEVCGSKVVAVDVVEAAPVYDRGITAIQAAKIAVEVLCYLEAR